MVLYGNALISLGVIVSVIAALSALLYFILWRGEGRILRKRLRETYGEQCCRPFRREYRKRGTDHPFPRKRGGKRNDAFPLETDKGEL